MDSGGKNHAFYAKKSIIWPKFAIKIENIHENTIISLKQSLEMLMSKPLWIFIMDI